MTNKPTAPHAAIAADDETPLLIVGMPRTGTRLGEQIVSSHFQTSVGRWRRYEPWLGALRDLPLQPEGA